MKQFVATNLVMTGNVGEYSCQRPDLDRAVRRNGDMVFSILKGRKPNVAARLPRYFISKHFQRTSERYAAYITWQFHAARTSSLTK